LKLSFLWFHSPKSQSTRGLNSIVYSPTFRVSETPLVSIIEKLGLSLCMHDIDPAQMFNCLKFVSFTKLFFYRTKHMIFCSTLEQFDQKNFTTATYRFWDFFRNLLIIHICYTILVIPMAMEETVCAKVPAELKKKLSSLGVNVSKVIRESLQSEVDRLEKEHLKKLAKEVSIILKKIPTEEFAESIRASRESR
jgi:hypothetical protein